MTATPAAAGRESVARPAARVAAATLVSRVLGLVREAVFAALFATTWLADAFVFAFRIPNLLRDVFAEGALAGALVPTLAEAEAQGGRARALELARRALGLLLVLTGVVAALGIAFAPAVVALVAVDAPATLAPTIAHLVRIMFPFLVLVSAAAVAMGFLQLRGRYFLPALAPAFFNVAAVVGGGVLLVLGTESETALVAWAVLVLVGGALQFLVQVPALLAEGWRGAPLWDLRLRDPALRRMLWRMGPVVLSTAATNVMVLLTTALASRAEGWASALSYAFRLVHLPIGLVGVALGTVVLTAGARRRAAGDPAALDDLGRRALRWNALLSLPAAIGLLVLAEPIVALVYERGTFGAEATRSTALALAGYAFGTLGYAGVKAAAPLFLARGDARTPTLCSLAGIGANLAVAFGFIGTHGHVALAAAVAVGATVNFLLLRLLSRVRHGPGSFPGGAFLLRVGLAGGALAVAAWGLGRAFPDAGRPGARWQVLPLLVLPTAAYAAALVLLRVEEAVALLRRRRRA